MKSYIEDIRIGVQEALDELFSERLIPFELTAYKVDPENPGEYVVGFCDSRMHSITLRLADGQNLKEVVRAVVLERTKRSSALYEAFHESRGLHPLVSFGSSKTRNNSGFKLQLSYATSDEFR